MCSHIASGCLLRVVPTSDIGSKPVRFSGSPRARFIRMHWSDVTQYRLDDGPRSFHGILADEKQGVTVHRVREQSLVGLQLAGSSPIHRGEFRGHRVQPWTGALDSGAKTQREIGTQPEA